MILGIDNFGALANGMIVVAVLLAAAVVALWWFNTHEE